MNLPVRFLLLHVLLWCWHLQESIQLSDSKDFGAHVSSQMGRHDTSSLGVERTVQLYSRASHGHVRIYGKNVDASGEDGEVYARLIIEGDNFDSQVTIRGEKTGAYLCMNHKGKVFSKRKRRDDNVWSCTFQEQYSETHFSMFRSVAHPDWYLGFGKYGQTKNGQRIRRGQKATEFLKREVPEEAELTHSQRLEKQRIFGELFRTSRRASRSKKDSRSHDKDDKRPRNKKKTKKKKKEKASPRSSTER